MTRLWILLLLFPLAASADGSATGIPKPTQLNELAAFQGNPDLDVQSYDIRFTLASMHDAAARIVERIRIRALVPVPDIQLHIEPARIQLHSVRQAVSKLELGYRVLPGKPAQGGVTGSVLKIELPEILSAGSETELELDYEAGIQAMHGDSQDMRGLYSDGRIWGTDYVLALNWPYYARFWLPGNDHPSDPASFRFELHVPDGNLGIANGVLEGGDYLRGSGLDAEGLRVFRWSQEIPIQTYGVALAIAPLSVRSGQACFTPDPSHPSGSQADCAQAAVRLPEALFYPEKAASDDLFRQWDWAAKAAAFYSGLFGPYEFAKLGLLFAPYPFNMEAPSSIILNGGMEAATTSHEVGHHWWGDSVRIREWRDIWLSEGMTTYVTALFMESVTGFYQGCGTGPGALVGPVDADPLTYYRSTYCRGASAMAELRSELARLQGLPEKDEAAKRVFFAVLRALYQRLRMRVVGTSDALGFLDAELGRICREAGVVAASEPAIQGILEKWKSRWFTEPFKP